MKWPDAQSPKSTWFWLELVGNCCERLKIIMKYTNIQFCERLGHGWQFHPLHHSISKWSSCNHRIFLWADNLVEHKTLWEFFFYFILWFFLQRTAGPAAFFVNWTGGLIYGYWTLTASWDKKSYIPVRYVFSSTSQLAIMLTLYVLNFSEGTKKNIFTFYVIPPHWHDTGC